MKGWGVGVRTRLPSLRNARYFTGANTRLAKYLSCPGIVGNFASTPDAAANQLTGDLDLRVFVAADDWTPPGFCAIFGKDSGVNPNRSWMLYQETGGNTGKLGFIRSLAGVANFAVSSIVVPFADTVFAGLRVTDNRATGDVNFFTSVDFGITWTPLGATIVFPVGAADAGNAAVSVGANAVGTSPYFGEIMYAEARNGINGPVVVSFDPSRALINQTQIQSATGEVWTINTAGGGQIAQLF